LISREWIEPAIAAAVEEWHQGRVADPTLAPVDIPDLSQVSGYSLDDVRYNCVGHVSPAQKRQALKTFGCTSLGLAVVGAFTAVWFAAGARFVPVVTLLFIGVALLKAMMDAGNTWAGNVSQVDGDVTTEIERDSESADRYFAHISELRLEITKAAYEVMMPGGPYRIFYLRGPGRAIGGQVLPGWRPVPQRAEEKRRWWQRLSIEL